VSLKPLKGDISETRPVWGTKVKHQNAAKSVLRERERERERTNLDGKQREELKEKL